MCWPWQSKQTNNMITSLKFVFSLIFVCASSTCYNRTMSFCLWITRVYLLAAGHVFLCGLFTQDS